VAFVNFDQSFPGRSILVLKYHYEDFLVLPERLAYDFMKDMKSLARAISGVFDPDLFNYAMLGNAVRHLHWHIIPRYADDVNWGRPPWPVVETRLSSSQEYYRVAKRIRNRLTVGAHEPAHESGRQESGEPVRTLWGATGWGLDE
jgi:diadenosine tetraphosphate (Ap4A) HIT family hydrolase